MLVQAVQSSNIGVILIIIPEGGREEGREVLHSPEMRHQPVQEGLSEELCVPVHHGLLPRAHRRRHAALGKKKVASIYRFKVHEKNNFVPTKPHKIRVIALI